MADRIGIILTGATTLGSKVQILEEYERKVREGMFVIVQTKIGDEKKRILGRVTKLETYNEFFEVGDLWSEARRKGKEIPTSIAKRYTIATVEFLGVLPGLTEVTTPPTPGDPVLLIERTDEIFRVDSKGVYIEFGEIYGYKNIPVPLTVEGIPMHMAFIGVTGSGKSYTVGYFIEKLAELKEIYGRAIPMIIIDANADYIDYFMAYNEGKFTGFNSIRRIVFNDSTARETGNYSDIIRVDLRLDDYGLSPPDLAEMIIDYYKTAIGAELQISVLQTLFENLRAEGSIDLNFLFEDNNEFRNLMRRLDNLRSEFHHASVEAAKRALRIFRDSLVQHKMLCSDAFDECVNWRFLEDIVENEHLALFDFSADGATGIPVKMKQFVVAYLAVMLYKLFVHYKMKNQTKYLVFVIEEAQNYCPNISKYPIGANVARKYIALIATQGRKFGLSLALVTQRPVYVDPIAMAMVNTFFIHRTAPDDASYLRKLLGGVSADLFNKIPNLETGHLVLHGQMVPFNFPILVRVPKRKIEPSIGKTDVSGFFKS